MTMTSLDVGDPILSANWPRRGRGRRKSTNATPSLSWSFVGASSTLQHRKTAGAERIFEKMAPGQKMYPRGTVKKIVKAHSNCSVSKNVDVLVGLSFQDAS